MEECIFCKIANKEIPSKIVLENEKVIAFEDLNPIAPVHILVIPKKHIASVMGLKEEDTEYLKAVYEAIQEIAKQKKVDKTGFRVLTNVGDDAGQTIKHLHFHVIGGRKLEMGC